MSRLNIQNKVKLEIPVEQIIDIFDQLDQEGKIALRYKLERTIEKKFSQTLKEIWKENKNKDLKQVMTDVDEAVKKIRKSSDKSSR